MPPKMNIIKTYLIKIMVDESCKKYAVCFQTPHKIYVRTFLNSYNQDFD